MPMSILPAIEKLSSQAMFFFSDRYTNSALAGRHGHDDQRRPVAGAGEQSLAGHERADVAADVRAHETDEHGRHGAVAEADAGGGLGPVVAEALEVALVEKDRQDHTPHDAHAHEQGDRREALRRHLGGGQGVHADLLGRSLRDLRLIM